MNDQLSTDIQAFLNSESIALKPGWPPTLNEIESALSEDIIDEAKAQWWYEMVGADWKNREPFTKEGN